MKSRRNLIIGWVLFVTKILGAPAMAFHTMHQRRNLGCSDYHALQTCAWFGTALLFAIVGAFCFSPDDTRMKFVVALSALYALCSLTTATIINRCKRA